MSFSQHIVPPDTAPQRLSEYAVGIFAELPSRKGVRKAIERGEMLVNGAPSQTGYWVQPGDRLEWIPALRPIPKIFPRKLSIIFEDEYLAVINKPAGLPVSGNFYKSVQRALPHNLDPSPAPGGLAYAIPVHRLDGPTSGMLIVARTQLALIELGRAFQEHRIRKTYHALVQGEIPYSGYIDQPLDGQKALTSYRRLDLVHSRRMGPLSRVELHPHTGRTHQLRRHMAELGCPILGDQKYASAAGTIKGKGLFLAAVGLRFFHPIEAHRELILRIATPHKLRRRMEREGNREYL